MKKQYNEEWCYSGSLGGNFYTGSTSPLTERWEAVEEGENLAKYEKNDKFRIGKIRTNGKIEDIEELKVST